LDACAKRNLGTGELSVSGQQLNLKNVYIWSDWEPKRNLYQIWLEGRHTRFLRENEFTLTFDAEPELANEMSDLNHSTWTAWGYFRPSIDGSWGMTDNRIHVEIQSVDLAQKRVKGSFHGVIDYYQGSHRLDAPTDGQFDAVIITPGNGIKSIPMRRGSGN
jgi:hypothetical protein